VLFVLSFRVSLERTTGFEPATPNLGNGMVVVSCVSAGLSNAPELHVLGALVSCLSPVDSISLVISLV
jgi:hypothetical protein